MTEIKLKTKLSAYAKGVIPTKVSQLEQDIDYTTEAPKDDKIYARKNGEWENISTEQDNKAYVRENDNWVELDEKLEEKKYIDEDELSDYDRALKTYISNNYIDNAELESYDLATKDYISQNYIDNQELTSYDTGLKSYISSNYIDNQELTTELSNYVTTTELNNRDYVADIPTANNKVYARKRGQWQELDLENMGAINIDTPTNSGLTSREIPKEESHEARNKYIIEMNKWEGDLANVPQQLEDGKFYYAVDPVAEDTLLNGGNSQTNQFEQQVDILTTRFQLRTDTQLNWETYNPILGYGEPGWEIDTHKLKIGDGVRAWNNLPYQSGENLNKNVLTNLTIQSNGDNLSLDREYTNLYTDVKTNSPVAVPLVDSLKAGLMSTADYIALQNVISKVEDLEGKTTRLLYVNTPVTQDIGITIDSVLESGSILKEGSIVNGVEIVTDTTLLVDTDLIVGDLIKTGSTIANSSLINNITYPNKITVNSFAIGEGYTSPFEGLAVVINGTYHIWHYYENDNIGWQDDGVDTVSNFTNSTAGIIKGSTQTGKVFAENDGSGSVNGWDNLTNTVSGNSSAITGLQTNVETLQTDVETIQTSIGTIETDITSLQGSVGTINSNITTIEGNITTLGNALSTVQTSVTNIQNAKVIEINSQSTNDTYPSTKAVYDYVNAYTPEITSLTKQEIDEMWADEPIPEEGVVEITSNNYTTYIDSDGGEVYVIITDEPVDDGVVEITSNNYTTSQDVDGGTIYTIYE